MLKWWVWRPLHSQFVQRKTQFDPIAYIRLDLMVFMSKCENEVPATWEFIVFSHRDFRKLGSWVWRPPELIFCKRKTLLDPLAYRRLDWIVLEQMRKWGARDQEFHSVFASRIPEVGILSLAAATVGILKAQSTRKLWNGDETELWWTFGFRNMFLNIP